MTEVSRIVSTPGTVYKVALLGLGMVLTLGWTAVAHAQPAETQYGNPAPKIVVPAGGGGSAEGAPASGRSAVMGGPASGGGSAEGAPASGRSAVMGGPASGGGSAKATAKVLPATGGPLLVPLVVFGVFALGSAGVLVLRQAARR